MLALRNILALFLASAALGGAENERGLVLRMESATQQDARPARTVALHVPKGGAVSPLLDSGPWKARWEGQLVLEKRSRLVFHLEGTGEARLLIDGEVLVPAIGKPNASKRISSGEHEFVVEYTPLADGDATLRLSWQGRDFGREPVPALAFLHDADDPELRKQSAHRDGRQLVAQKRCASCHHSGVLPAMPEMVLKAPSLDDVGERLRQDWLIKWISDPQAVRPSAHMPVVFQGKDAAEKVAHVAAYLSADAPGDVGLAATPEQIKEGGHIFHQQGCVACHTLDAKGDFERLGLGVVRMKFRHGALQKFLREPAKYHQGTRMPTFNFSEAEAAAVAGFLRSLVNDPGSGFANGDPKKGRALAKEAGCFNCHERKGETKGKISKLGLFALKSADCTGAKFDFVGGEKSKAAITGFLGKADHAVSLTRLNHAEFSTRQYEELRCNACHSRDGEESLREKFAEEVAHLKPLEGAVNEEKPAIVSGPPPLNHLGLKLRPEWRTKLFAGEIVPKVRKWLPARMPSFPSRAQGLSIGFSHAAGVPAFSPQAAASDPATLKIGESMIAVQGGLACNTCHGIAEKPPIAVFEGEGPNLLDAGARLTREYFHLWMNDPPRAWPGTIMPKYAIDGQTPLSQYYDGDARKQFDAVYEYLRSLSKK